MAQHHPRHGAFRWSQMVAAKGPDPKAYLLNTAIAPETRGTDASACGLVRRTRLVIGRDGEPRLLRPSPVTAY